MQADDNCDIAVAGTSPLAHTGHTPSSPPPNPVTATSTPRYLINPIAATTATMPPLAPTLTCVAGTHRPLRRCRSHCAYFFLVFILFYFSYFSFHLELVQDSVGCNTAAATTSPRVRTGYPVAIISPFWGTPAALLHSPLRASWVHASHRHCSPYLVPPLKKNCKSFVPFTSNFPLAHTPRCLTNLAPQGHFDKFFFFFFFFLLISNRCRTTALTTSPPSPPVARMKATPARLPPHHSRHASESATARPRHPRNSPTCPTWSPTHPLPRLHRLHPDTAARRRYNQRHLDPATTPPFVGTPATPLHPPSHASQAHIGPAALQLR